jgi:hypothetical protein
LNPSRTFGGGFVQVVVGPAADGGYYLLGMKAAHAALFENVAWSTGEVLTATLANAGACLRLCRAKCVLSAWGCVLG